MKFEDWFEKQFGKAPQPKNSLSDLWDETDRLRKLLNLAEAQVRERERWIDQRKAALYAWNMKEKDKI